jgi:hypothetical protein
MALRGVNIERWSVERELAAIKWLTDNAGPIGDQWWVEHDYNFVDLIMEEEIYTLFALRWL